MEHVAQSLLLYLQVGDRASWELASGSTQFSTRPHLPVLSKQFNELKPSIQTYEPVGNIFIQTSTLCLYLVWYQGNLGLHRTNLMMFLTLLFHGTV